MVLESGCQTLLTHLLFSEQHPLCAIYSWISKLLVNDEHFAWRFRVFPLLFWASVPCMVETDAWSDSPGGHSLAKCYLRRLWLKPFERCTLNTSKHSFPLNTDPWKSPWNILSTQCNLVWKCWGGWGGRLRNRQGETQRDSMVHTLVKLSRNEQCYGEPKVQGN